MHWASLPPSLHTHLLLSACCSASATPASAPLSPPPHDVDNYDDDGLLFFLSCGKNACEVEVRSPLRRFHSTSTVTANSHFLSDSFDLHNFLPQSIPSSRGESLLSTTPNSISASAAIVAKLTSEAKNEGQADGRASERARTGKGRGEGGAPGAF